MHALSHRHLRRRRLLTSVPASVLALLPAAASWAQSAGPIPGEVIRKAGIEPE